jgi:hypothetical protein
VRDHRAALRAGALLIGFSAVSGDVYSSYADDVETLRESWGVTGRHGWQTQVTALLEGRNSPADRSSRCRCATISPATTFVTSALGYDFGRAVNVARWG